MLDAEDITHVLRTVELTGDVLEGVQQAVAARNIRIDEPVEDVVEDTPTQGVKRPEGPPAEDADGLMARRRRRRNDRMNASGADSGNTADTVRMYLARDRPGRSVDARRRTATRAQAIEEGNIAALQLDSRGM